MIARSSDAYFRTADRNFPVNHIAVESRNRQTIAQVMIALLLMVLLMGVTWILFTELER